MELHHHICSYIIFLLMLTSYDCAATEDNKTVTIVAIIEDQDKALIPLIKDTLASVKPSNGKKMNITFYSIIFAEGEEFPAYLQICDYLLNGISLLVDLTWEGWTHAKSIADSLDLPYIHLDVTIEQFVHAADDFLRFRNATDAALVFPSESALDQGLLYLVGNTVIRIIVLDGNKGNSTDNLRKMKPVPSHFVMYGTPNQLKVLLEKANKSGLIARDTIWTIVQMDFGHVSLNGFPSSVSLIKPSSEICCSIMGMVTSKPGNTTKDNECDCNNNSISQMLVKNAFHIFGKVLVDMSEESNSIVQTVANCSNYTGPSDSDSDNSGQKRFMLYTMEEVNDLNYVLYNGNSSKFQWNVLMDVFLINASETRLVGKWSAVNEFENQTSDTTELAKRFFRVGTMIDVQPFVYVKKDANGNVMKNEYDEEILEGFCIELLQKLSEEMKFNYQIKIPEDHAFGQKLKNGTWTGLIGDLVNGETDMIVAPLTITSEREEVIDFVAPYFEQSGISIIMRRPVKTTSLFKFMSVLKDEVWWCILAALIVTALVLWVVDKYSPYSGRNKQLYPYKTREFTLSECFWFALTSMTPQGGGEPPKAVSGRILVAAYWIFVVLMLATFTANLAAFLTVERMQSPVNSMEELAKQSKINYTVVKDTTIHDYFINMAAAEEELYRVWKDMTLNSSNDQSKFRVWDYPIKEQYTRILSVITGTGLLDTAEKGYDLINNDADRKYAFIHDAATLRYQVYHNCNFTEVGEPFAEQPYAIAVQSGSHLQDEIGRHLLELQKDRYFETLSQRYWNSSLRKECLDGDESEGITLASIGGVFIATLVGLAIGMFTLIGEIFYYRKQRKSKVVAINIKPKKAMAEK